MSVTRYGLLLAALIALAAVPFVAHGSQAGVLHEGASYCPPLSADLDGVYHPSRLEVIKPCQRAAGTVRTIRHEEDGDLHIDVQLTSTYTKLLNSKNDSLQHGWLVVEFMPRDGGHLPEPRAGDRVTLVGAWVLDSEHDWNEIHPVWRLTLDGHLYTSGPQYGGSPAYARSANAEATCRTQHGTACLGYHHTVAVKGNSGGSSGAPAGATAKCRDGTYSYSQHRRGSCSHHGGVAVWLRSVPP